MSRRLETWALLDAATGSYFVATTALGIVTGPRDQAMLYSTRSAAESSPAYVASPAMFTAVRFWPAGDADSADAPKPVSHE